MIPQGNGNGGPGDAFSPEPAPASGPVLVRAEGVSKWYGQVSGLNNVTVSIPPGITGPTQPVLYLPGSEIVAGPEHSDMP